MLQTNQQVEATNRSLQSLMEEMGHEQLVFCNDSATGLKAIIAIHNTVLGPGMGGVRCWEYATDQEAITDALRLSRGMTYKNSIAGLNIGGGKAVIIGGRDIKTEALLRRLGRFIDSLGGRYVTAEDVGMSAKDMEYIGMETSFVTGCSENHGGSGDPSPVTAYGVYMGMKAAAKKVYGSDDLKGKKIYVQGVGHVGGNLVKLLVKENARVIISDLYEETVRGVAKEHGAEVIDPGADLSLEVDIYSPCALGATLHSSSIPILKCRIVAGGANNQLEDETLHAQMLKERGILYAPDFLINSGGITSVYLEYLGNYNRELAYQKAEEIYAKCLEIVDKAHEEGITTHQAALQIAKDRIRAMEKVKLSFKA